MNKLLKAVHHVGYLSSLKPGQLPPAIEDERKKLDRFWKPSSSNQTFRDDIQAESKQYFDSVMKILIRHHQSTVESLEAELKNKCSLNSTDFDNAQKKAIVWAKKNLGKRLKETSISKFEASMVDVKVCINPPSAHTGTAEPDATTSSNPSSTHTGTAAPVTTTSSKPSDTDQNVGNPKNGTPSDIKNKTPPSTPANSKKRKNQSSPIGSEPNSPLASRPRVEPVVNDAETPDNEQNNTTLATGSVSDKHTPTKMPRRPDSADYARAAASTPKRSRDEIDQDPTSPATQSPTNKISRTVSPPKEKRLQRLLSIKPFCARKESPSGSWVFPNEINHPTVCLGDSNNNNITKSRDKKVHIISFPGGDFRNIKGFLKGHLKGKTYSCVKNVILNFGINERKTETSEMKKRLSTLISQIHSTFPSARIFMADPQWSPLLPEIEISALSHISVEIKRLEAKGDIYMTLPKLPNEKFVIDPKDRSKIHWTHECANEILDSWLEILN